MELNSICVYCASSAKIDKIYFDKAKELGRIMAEQDIECICGAGNKGLMGALADEIIANNGRVKGIIPRFMYDEDWYHQSITDLILTDSMHERKTLMAENSDAVIAMPGGVGTFEELLEIITWKQLGLYMNPIVILNINNYYDPLLKMLENAVEENFMQKEHSKIWMVTDSPIEAINLDRKSVV